MSGYQSYQSAGNVNSNGIYAQDKSSPLGGGLKWIVGVIIFVVAAVVIDRHVFREPTYEPVPVAAYGSDDDLQPNGKLKLFDGRNRFVLEDYDAKPTFSSFLPGVAGLYGKPVWAFYVNRGQGIASFGTVSKDFPMMEYSAANKAYQLTPFVGFRSFIKAVRDGTTFVAEPFSPSESRYLDGSAEDDSKPKRIMYVGPNEFEVKEVDYARGLTTDVTHVVVPEEDFSALLRRATYTNSGSTPLKISVLDGLAKMEPVGGKLDWGLKNMGRTLEGWMGVYHASDDLTMPFYRMSTEPGDTASVVIEKAGHYCLSFIENNEEDAVLLPVVYDSSKVFGRDTSLFAPNALYDTTVSDILANPQYGDATTSSAFGAVEDITLQPGESFTIATFYGKAEHVEEVPKIASHVTKAGYVASKFNQARELIADLTAGVETNTSSHLFDGAVRQMYLDNSLRGGMPVILGDIDSKAKSSTYDEDSRVKVFHAFSRIHGDLERDYNAFAIADSYFSQGPGNFRDIAQNRRDDVTFHPHMGTFDVKQFLSFIQADGYEPLTVEAVSFTIADRDEASKLAKEITADDQSASKLQGVFWGGAFRPGQLFQIVDDLDIKIALPENEFINRVLAAADDNPMAVYGSGYWADHWEYYLDLIDAYLAIYPDFEENLMYDNELAYFFSTATIKPRSTKYVFDSKIEVGGFQVKQLDSTYFDDGKVGEQADFRAQHSGAAGLAAAWQRTTDGTVVTSSPLAKLFLLGTIKFATRDAYGMGIEYEGGRPGWNDAMNGLPGMVGSGMPETYEMQQVLNYVLNVVTKYHRPITVPAELGELIDKITGALDALEASPFTEPQELPLDVPGELFTYWDAVATAREEYRSKIQYHFSGETKELPADEVISLVKRFLAQTEIGMDRAMKLGSRGKDDDGTSGVPPCYFSFKITSWTETGKATDAGLPYVNANAMRVGQFPLFLEGPVRYLKTIRGDVEAARDLYGKVKNSGLRDTKLNMYFLSATLEGQSYDMGRMMAFSPGWLENQSIWLHMAYKYYLELIRGGLFEEFFGEMRGGGILPYMDPDVYGRSVMECSSFIASSAFPDPETAGRGFSARLSGSTAEFLSMWKLMFIGPEPFFVDDDKEVKMQLVPALPYWIFEEDEGENQYDADGNPKVSFKLFGSITVIYHNTVKTNLYRVAPKKYDVTMKDGNVSNVKGPIIPSVTAKKIRQNVDVASIDVYF